MRGALSEGAAMRLRRKHTRASSEGHRSKGLDEVICVEERLAVLIAGAERDARALLEEANARARAREERIDGEIRRGCDAAVREAEAARAEALREIEDRARRECMRFDQLAPASIQALADRVLARVLASMAPGSRRP